MSSISGNTYSRRLITMSVCCAMASVVLRPRAVVGFSLFTRSSSNFKPSVVFSFSRKQQFSSLYAATSSSAPSVEDATESGDKKVPVTLLSGFLGSGKTTALKHLLENKAGIKVGVIVNDVASVNIDAKLISSGSESDGAIELQNGCACCSLADELLVSLDMLIENQKAKDASFDAIVVELSGVADPVSVKQNWQDAVVSGHPATKKATVDRVVTVVDASTFGTDWFSWNSAGERTGWVVPGDECAATRKVAELLAEQVEAADILIVNKIDLAGPEQTKVAMAVANGINSQSKVKTISETAKIFTSSFGQVPLEGFLGLEERSKTVAPAEKSDACDEPGCTDASHSHDHAEHDCSEPDCTDTSHSHDHNEHACSEPACTDTSHSHDHNEHAHNDDEACTDAACDDPTHDHSHNHSHATATSTSTSELGISSFVYKSPRPFDSNRLMALLNKWPVPLKEELDIELMKAATKEGFEVEEGMDGDSPFAGVLRSKGFCWLSPTQWSQDPWRHDTAMYWSHAGKHFGIQTAGKWWGSMTPDQMERFGSINPEEYERIRREDFVSEEWGDRRQELVFIGVELSEDDITTALNKCLMNDEELDMYRVQAQNLANSMMSKEASSGGPSLMDVGSTDHIDAP